MSQLNASRRLFLHQAGALSTLGAVGAPLALNLAAVGSAAAQAATDYKALVCLFLFGGNDSINMVLPTDAASFANYTAVRNQAPDSLALLAPGTAKTGGVGTSPAQLGGVLPITPLTAQAAPAGGTRTFALHPVMIEAQALFGASRLAVVPNVGPLVVPLTKAQYSSAAFPKPKSLFSHNDQQNTWQSFRPEGASVGWGGRLADLVASGNTRATFTSISTSGSAVWLSGQTIKQYQVGVNGAIRMGTNGSGQIYGSADVGAAMSRIVGATRGGHVFEADMAAVAQRSLDAELTLRTALKPASDALFGTPVTAPATYNANNDPKLRYNNPITGGSAFNSLAQQLQIVARMIDASSNSGIGARRQVFFVSMGGFDTHDLQNRNHADLMARLSHALQYFDNTMSAMAASDKVTLFTASDFGRTFTSNGDGTDHGWGANHFVLGGAVKGGDFYGTYPVLGAKNTNNNNFDSSADQLGNGTLLPTTSVDQLGATLAEWFGVTGTTQFDVFPNLQNFSARPNLGFMKPG